MTFIIAVTPDVGVLYYETYQRGVKHGDVCSFLESLSVILGEERAVLLMDNAPNHRALQDPDEERRVTFLPAYSPFLNAIENSQLSFSVLKAHAKQPVASSNRLDGSTQFSPPPAASHYSSDDMPSPPEEATNAQLLHQGKRPRLQPHVRAGARRGRGRGGRRARDRAAGSEDVPTCLAWRRRLGVGSPLGSGTGPVRELPKERKVEAVEECLHLIPEGR